MWFPIGSAFVKIGFAFVKIGSAFVKIYVPKNITNDIYLHTSR